jgi:YidC/Oxa1 family membrane protein insertase
MLIGFALYLASILSPLENVMKSILDFFHDTIGLPWGWSIVAVTIVVRLCLVPLAVRSIHSMQSLQAHAPEMKAIQNKYKGDRQKQSEELQKFYKENHINPAASCLPTVAQFPVFIALYFTLRHQSHNITGTWLHVVHVADRHATQHWAGFLLLALYAGSQVASTYFMGATMQKSQRTMMMILPLVFVFFVSQFPTGLVLYWVTTNLWTVGQGLITRRLMPKPGSASLPTGPKRSSRTPPATPPPAADNGKTEDPPKPAQSGPRRVKKKGGARR